MSKEYIEREAAVAFLENMAASRYLIQSFENKEKFPAADVAPVIHGEWIECGKDDNDMTIVQCSICQIKRYGAPAYCSRCGARMDGGNAAAGHEAG